MLYISIIDSFETIKLPVIKLIEKEIHQIVEDNPIKYPTEFGMDWSFNENTRKV